MARRPPPGALPFAFDARYWSSDRGAALRRAALLFSADVRGVETVAVAPDGAAAALVDREGRVFIARADDSGGFSRPPALVARLPAAAGRALGVRFDGPGALLICSAPMGLLRLELPSGSGDGAGASGGPARLFSLAARVSADSPLAPGRWLAFVNSVEFADGGGANGGDDAIYFTSSTDLAPFRKPDGHWDTLEAVYASFAAAAPSGLLLRYDRATGKATALADGFWFANGVALSEDGSFLAVADSLGGRVMRHWLRGPKAGTTEQFTTGLPGAPDGVFRASDGGFWVAVHTTYPPIVKLAASRLVRALMMWTPPAVRPKAPPRGLVVKLSPAGAVELALADATGAVVRYVTSAVEAPRGGGGGGSGGGGGGAGAAALWLGSLEEHGVWRLELAGALREVVERGGAGAEAAAAMLRRIEGTQ